MLGKILKINNDLVIWKRQITQIYLYIKKDTRLIIFKIFRIVYRHQKI